MSELSLPPPREPVIDPRTNTFSRNWILYFQQLFTRVGGSNATAVLLSDFTGANQRLEPNGYQALPGGFVRQWGTATLSADGSVAITFPVSFETACVSVKCEETGATSASGVTFAHSTPSKTGVSIYGSGAGTTNAIKTFDWEAIGY